MTPTHVFPRLLPHCEGPNPSALWSVECQIWNFTVVSVLCVCTWSSMVQDWTRGHRPPGINNSIYIYIFVVLLLLCLTLYSPAVLLPRYSVPQSFIYYSWIVHFEYIYNFFSIKIRQHIFLYIYVMYIFCCIYLSIYYTVYIFWHMHVCVYM